MQDPSTLASELESVTAALKRDIAAWLAEGGDPVAIAEGARRHQELYRSLRDDPELACRVVNSLEPALGESVRAHVEAARKLRGLVTPVESPAELDLTEAAQPRELRRFYAEAEAAHAVPWHVLAAINFAESRFGRVLGPSVAGALGPMQFLPATWERHGAGGDVMDPRESILAAARYLKALGADADLRSALFAYNRSDEYVDAILTYASEMEADETAFYVYYFWRVVVATTEGDVSVT